MHLFPKDLQIAKVNDILNCIHSQLKINISVDLSVDKALSEIR